MKGGKRRWYLPGVAAAVLVYQFIFPIPLTPELQLSPVWTSSASGGTVKEASPSEAKEGTHQAFRLNQSFGYVDRESRILFQEKIPHGVALHGDFFIAYTSQPRSLVVRRWDGNFLATIPESGYPFIRGDRLFLLSADGFSLSEWTLGGEKIWTRTFPSLLTAMDAGREAAVLGFLDGTFLVLGEKGEDIFTPPMPESRYGISLQVGVSGDGRYIAAVQGIEPQTLSVFEKNGKNFRLLYSRELESDYRRPVKGGFFTASSHFVVEQPRGLGIFTPRWRRFSTLELSGTLRALAESPRYELLFALREEGNSFYLSAFLASGKEVLRFAYPRDPAHFLQRKGDDLLLGSGDRLFYIRVETG